MGPSTVGVSERARSYPVFMAASLSNAFALKRGLFFLLVPLPALALCLYFRHAVLGFALMAAGFWPFPFRCRVEPGGIRVSWLVVNERLSWDDIRTVTLGEDRRRGVMGRRGNVLTIERVRGSRVTLRGRSEVLSDVASEIAPRLRPSTDA